MKKRTKWNPGVARKVKRIPGREYENLVAELAKVIYFVFCQRDRDQNQSIVPETNTTIVIERTGTDG